MEKQVIIVNGRGGVGKDTICRLAGKYYPARSISSITPIVEIARFAGWDGVKTPAARRMLSQLKAVFTEWGNLSFSYCMREYAAFCDSEDTLLFVHIREAEEIARFREAVGTPCRALLVRRHALERRGPLGNRSDDGVEEYCYDYYFDNDGPLEGLEQSVRDFFRAALTRKQACGEPLYWRYAADTGKGDFA